MCTVPGFKGSFGSVLITDSQSWKNGMVTTDSGSFARFVSTPSNPFTTEAKSFLPPSAMPDWWKLPAVRKWSKDSREQKRERALSLVRNFPLDVVKVKITQWSQKSDRGKSFLQCLSPPGMPLRRCCLFFCWSRTNFSVVNREGDDDDENGKR